MTRTAEEVVAELELAPHPEGGFYREIWRSPAGPASRAAVTSIYFLLPAGVVSRWHRVDADEIWYFHDGASLALDIVGDGGRRQEVLDRPGASHSPQAVVPAGAWQSARSLGDWTLVGCAVAPGFEFSGFELAPPDWTPDDPESDGRS